MFRSLCSCIAAVALLLSTTSGAMAAAWKEAYTMQTDTLYGLLDENESAGMAYLKVPFGGPISRPNKATWGFSVVSRLPYEFSHVQLGSRRGVATLLDLKFNGTKVEDLRINGLSMNESYRRLNAAGDERSSAWVTYGIMILAAGAAAAVILIGNSNDEPNDIPAIPGQARRKGFAGGCGDGLGNGNGDGQGDGNLGPTDNREFFFNPEFENDIDEAACFPPGTQGFGGGGMDGGGPGAGDGMGGGTGPGNAMGGGDGGEGGEGGEGGNGGNGGEG
jgi:hypothetical protein